MGFLSKAKQTEKIRRSKFQEVKYIISIVFLWEKMFGRSTAYSCQKNGYVEFPHFMTKKLQQNVFKSVGTNGFCRKTAPQKLVLLIR